MAQISEPEKEDSDPNGNYGVGSNQAQGVLNQLGSKAPASNRLVPLDKFRKVLQNFEEVYRACERKSAIRRKPMNDLEPDTFIKDVLIQLSRSFGSQKIHEIYRQIFKTQAPKKQ